MMRKPVSPEGGVYYPALFPLICAALFPGILLSGCNENMKPEQPPANLGEEIFVSNCTACHSLEPGMRKVGPSLHGLLGREVKLSSGKVFLRDKDYIQKSITDPDAEIVAGFDGGICQTSVPSDALSGKKWDALVEYLTGPKTGNKPSPAKEPEEKK